MSRSPSHRTDTRRLWLTAAVVVLCVAVAANAVHRYALSLDARARDVSAPAGDRRADAGRARQIEPWNDEFELTHAIASATTLLQAQRVDEAYFLLLPFTVKVRGDELFRATYQRALKAKWALDSRKAHQQHAREKADGGLDPEDVLK